jgi:hypothetical protein
MASKTTVKKVPRRGPKTEGPKGLRGGRLVDYQGKPAKVVSLLSNVKAKIKMTEIDEEVTVLRKDLSFLKKSGGAAKKVASTAPEKMAMAAGTYDKDTVATLLKKCKERGIEGCVGKIFLPKRDLIRLLTKQDEAAKSTEEKKPVEKKSKKAVEKKPDNRSRPRYFPNQPSLTIIRPKYFILSTLLFPSRDLGREIWQLGELQSAVLAVNKELSGDKSTNKPTPMVKLAFVNFNSDRDQAAEDAINAEVDPDNKHTALKTAIKELQHPPSGEGGIEIRQLMGELIALDVGNAYTVPYVQILNTFAKKLGLQRYGSKQSNPTSLISFHVPEDGEEEPHATQFIHNVLLFSYAD